MLKKFLEDVVVIVVGKQAEKIADILDNKKHVNEFIIAKKLDITINQTRNILYKLSDYGLVSSIRKKDKKKGWYTYFWRFEISKSLEFLRSEIEKKVVQIKNQIKSKETKQFYICEKCNIEFNEENVLLHNFVCPECGEVLSLKDNMKSLRDLKRNLEKLEKEKEIINEELMKEKEKTDKIKSKEMEKIEKEKKKKRAKDREERKIAKKREEKKSKSKIEKPKKIKKAKKTAKKRSPKKKR
ncbi:MAG: hypothetical protein WC584_01440 [Candidatus Pacearchaeota archaeon]